jgi:hypothetical protein
LFKLCLSVQIAFTAIFALIAASVYASDRMTGTYDELYHIPVVCWALLLAAIFPVARLSGRLVDLCVCLVEICFQDFDNVHYLLMGVSAALRCDTAFSDIEYQLAMDMSLLVLRMMPIISMNSMRFHKSSSASIGATSSQTHVHHPVLSGAWAA